MRSQIFGSFTAVLLFALLLSTVQAQEFEEAVVDVGNVGLTVTNSGFIGKASIRNNPTGPPSFEYPLDSGVEHLFESGLWVGATRSDGTTVLRSGAVTTSAGYQPGLTGYEFTALSSIRERSSLTDSDAFTSSAISHQDFLSSFTDTASVLPGTQIPHPDPSGRLGLVANTRSYAWNFPFTEYFVLIEFEIINVSDAPWDDVYVGLYHDQVVRNVNTALDQGGAFFDKGGYGVLDTLYASYAFNAGGAEESINTYSAIAFLGADWVDPANGQSRFFHPRLADEYVADGLTPPTFNTRWWNFGSNPNPELARTSSDEERYRRLATPYPNPENFPTVEEYEQARGAWYQLLRTGGAGANGNWIGMSSVGPFSRVGAGDTLRVTFAAVAALKPEEFQDFGSRSLDIPESRALLVENIRWAQRTYGGEDNNTNGRIDGEEDVNGNGVLDRFLIPEPPQAPNVRAVLEEGRVTLYWDRASETGRDPVTGLQDFEGYRIYRTDPGDDRTGDLLGAASLVAQYDKPSNRTGFNNGFGEIALSEPVTFADDTTRYYYRFESDGLLSGWQYGFVVTAFDEGDLTAGLPSFESSRRTGAIRVFPGTPAAQDDSREVGVYPNPYRLSAAWDGSTSQTRKLNFYNLPAQSEVRIYTLAGEIVASFTHDADTYSGDIRWYNNFSADNRLLAGGEHSWDLLSENGLSLSTGLYLYSVKDLNSGDTQTGKFAIIK